MITQDLELKLVDLGYGLNLEGRQKNGYMITKLGTEMYMAPEIERSKAYQG